MALLTTDETFVLWQAEVFEIYHLDSDGSEHLIESDDEFNELVGTCTLAIEVGVIHPHSLFDDSEWEQRRYEIAKDILSAQCTGQGFDPLHHHENTCAVAVKIADELIKQLKGE